MSARDRALARVRRRRTLTRPRTTDLSTAHPDRRSGGREEAAFGDRIKQTAAAAAPATTTDSPLIPIPLFPPLRAHIVESETIQGRRVFSQATRKLLPTSHARTKEMTAVEKSFVGLLLLLRDLCDVQDSTISYVAIRTTFSTPLMVAFVSSVPHIGE